MALKRTDKGIVLKNEFTKDEAEYIILVGSETGSTLKFASLFYSALTSKKLSVYMSELNKYDHYKKAKHLIVFTSTYGEGEAPANASRFHKLFQTIDQSNILKYAIVGFGSLAYKNYCK